MDLQSSPFELRVLSFSVHYRRICRTFELKYYKVTAVISGILIEFKVADDLFKHRMRSQCCNEDRRNLQAFSVQRLINIRQMTILCEESTPETFIFQLTRKNVTKSPYAEMVQWS